MSRARASTATSARGRASRERDAEREPSPAGAASSRGIALGFLAMLPLFAAYEAALARIPNGARNLGEVVVSAPLSALGEHLPLARALALGALAVLALVEVSRGAGPEYGLLPRLWRIVLEGALAAVVLGPLRLVLLAVVGVDDGTAGLRADVVAPPPLARAASVAGGAAYEEIVFRVGLQSLLFVAVRALLELARAPERAARAVAEIVALVGAALAFAAAHLALVLDAFGPGGEAWDPTVFTWRALAGILLGTLFRWRGPGVAAWAHAFFNLALSIGAGPDVFL